MVKKMSNPDLSSQGFGMVEVIVSTGIAMVLAAMITQLLMTQASEQKFLSQKLEMNDFSNNFISTMARANSCDCQFANNATNPNLGNYGTLFFDSTITNGTAFIDIQRIYSGCAGGTNPPILLAGAGAKLFGTTDLIVDTVKIVDLMPAGANPNEWYGSWQISFLVGPGSLQRSAKPIKVGQKFIINPAVPAQTRVTSCGGLINGSGTQNRIAKWSATVGILDDSAIFEGANGKIGIGTTSPGVDVGMVSGLTVNGTGATQLTVQQNGVSGFAMNILNGDFQLYDKTGGTWHNSLNSTNGNISLPSGVLAVAGEARVGISNLLCNAQNEGYQRYNMAIHDYEFCNGTAWVRMGSPAATAAVAPVAATATAASTAATAASTAAAAATAAVSAIVSGPLPGQQGAVCTGSGGPGITYYNSGIRGCCRPGLTPFYMVGTTYYSYMFCDAY